MDITQALKDAENTLRDFIAATLQIKFGSEWEEKCGVSSERVQKWKERKLAEVKRQESGAVDERLLYYADFYDLKTILKKHWSEEFSQALGDWKTMEVWLTELEKLRDPDAHRRELMPHQKHLIIGISGEIRTRIAKFRSSQDTSESYFPRIESVRDNLGNIWTFGRAGDFVGTKMNLRPGDTLDFVITASDPLGDNLEYGIFAMPGREHSWQESNSLSLTIQEKHIGTQCNVSLAIRSSRDYHAKDYCDDFVVFGYVVLPKLR